MNLAIIYPAPSVIKDGSILVREPFGRRITGLSKHFNSITLFLPVYDIDLHGCTFPVNRGNIKVHELPSTRKLNFLAAIKLIPSHIRLFMRSIDNYDVAYFGYPSLLSFPLWVIAKFFRKLRPCQDRNTLIKYLI